MADVSWLLDVCSQIERASVSTKRDYEKITSLLTLLKESDITMTDHIVKKTNIHKNLKNLKSNHFSNKEVAALVDAIILKWKLNLYDQFVPALNQNDEEKKEAQHSKKQQLTSSQKSEISAAALANLTKIRVTDNFVFFYGGCFSQFYAAAFIVDNVQYFCAEQYMMAEKARLFKDEETLKHILAERKEPANCKQLGRKVSNFDGKLWDAHKQDIVYNANLSKFTQNDDLKHELLKYEKRSFVEASPNDKVWGIGLALNDEKCNDEKTWQGTNLLGIALTKVRDHILASAQQPNDENIDSKNTK
eukprot:CAMPEP_0197048512 /NCGR_PEP_ID=MMETSP1384-20130603/23848_1 /TAXON_ID=29189 /ORGANISM="Ammonia sp." /LENGTH=303 /DNA_ID=CAMNT_0042480655 /DNA_START=42 /DNA_END=953 /DNA_ORIENTATION=-